MARTDTTDGQALWQPGGAEDSCFCEGDRHLLAYKEEEGPDISAGVQVRVLVET